jgi:hypothetical protein
VFSHILVHYLKLDVLNRFELFKKTKWYKRHPSVRQLVAEIGGHPRSLVGLGQVLETPEFRATYLDRRHLPFAELLSAWNTKVRQIGSSPMSVPAMDAAITQCLLGTSVSLDKLILANGPADGPTYSYYISEVRCLLLLFLVHVVCY